MRRARAILAEVRAEFHAPHLPPLRRGGHPPRPGRLGAADVVVVVVEDLSQVEWPGAVVGG